MEPARISIARVLALGIPLSWEDAIAIAQGILLESDTALLMSGEQALVRPDTCFITATGDVSTPHTDPSAPPDGTVDLLRQLLAGRETPPEVARIAASPDTAAVIAWLSHVPLADPAERIAAVARAAFARQATVIAMPSASLLTPRRSRPADAPTADAPLPPSPPTPSAPLAPPPPAEAPAPRMAAAAAMRVAAPLQLVVPPPEPAAPPAPAPAPESALLRELRQRLHLARSAPWVSWRRQHVVPVAAAFAVAAIAMIGIRIVRNEPRPPVVATTPLPAGIIGFARAVPSQPPSAVYGRSASGDGGGSAPALSEIDASPLDLQGLMAWPRPASEVAPQEPPEPAVSGGDTSVLPPPPDSPAPAPVPASAVRAVPGEADRVFSAADTDVVPPAFPPRQRALGVHEPGTPVPRDWPYLLIVVDEQGGVESVRLFAPETRPGESLYRQRMLVAAAKVWRFVPAARNGRPVRYALRLPLDP